MKCVNDLSTTLSPNKKEVSFSNRKQQQQKVLKRTSGRTVGKDIYQIGATKYDIKGQLTVSRKKKDQQNQECKRRNQKKSPMTATSNHNNANHGSQINSDKRLTPSTGTAHQQLQCLTTNTNQTRGSLNETSVEVTPFMPLVQGYPINDHASLPDQLLQSRQGLLNRLLDDRRKTMRERIVVKAQQQKADTQTTCPFRPLISSKSMQFEADGLTHDRLYQEARVRKQRQIECELEEANRKRMQQESLKHVKLSDWSKHLNQQARDMAPIWQRLPQIHRQKLLRQKQLSEYHSNGQTFQPTINLQSIQLIQQRYQPNDRDFVSRVIEDMRQRKVRQEQMKQEMERDQGKSCTFRPKINVGCPPNREFNKKSQEGVGDRGKSIKGQSETQLLFNPSINPISNIIASKSRQHQTVPDQLYRLSTAPIQSRSQARLSLEKSLYAQYTFHPTINSLSRRLNHSHSKPHCCSSMIDYGVRIQAQDPQATFRPQINVRSQMMSQRERELINGKLAMKSKTKLKAVHKSAIQQTIQQCTFNPRTTPRPTKQILQGQQVKGLERWVETRRDRRMEIERQRAEVEWKLWKLEERYDQRMERIGGGTKKKFG